MYLKGEQQIASRLHVKPTQGVVFVRLLLLTTVVLFVRHGVEKMMSIEHAKKLAQESKLWIPGRHAW